MYKPKFIRGVLKKYIYFNSTLSIILSQSELSQGACKFQYTCIYSYFILTKFTFPKLALKHKRQREGEKIFYSPLTTSFVLCRRKQRSRRKSVIPVILDVDCKHTWEHRFVGFLYGCVWNEKGWGGEDGAEYSCSLSLAPSSLLPPAARSTTCKHMEFRRGCIIIIHCIFLKNSWLMNFYWHFWFIPYLWIQAGSQ